jgi:FkbM family methyltransferase
LGRKDEADKDKKERRNNFFIHGFEFICKRYIKSKTKGTMRIALLKRKILNVGALWISYVKLFPWIFRLNKHSIVMDCGANVGHISLYLSKTRATIYAFEPDPVAFARLAKRCGHIKNITCINKGVWDRNATINLYRHHEMSTQAAFTVSSSVFPQKKNITDRSAIEIEVVNLVEFIKSLNKKVDLVKIDIEGAEIEILKKVIETDAHTLFKIMYVETHETKIPDQKVELEQIRMKMKEKQIGNIILNWI